MTRKLKIWALQDVLDVIEGRVGDKFDVLIVIEGRRGLGKSTLAYKVGTRLKIPNPFRPRRDIIYTRQDSLKHLANKKGGFIFNDEMVNVTYNRDFYIEDQKLLIKALNMYRDSCNVFVMCIPNFQDLDVQIRNLCSLRLSVVRRGVALIQRPKQSLYTADPWDIATNKKIEAKWYENGNKNPKYGQLTTAIGILKYGDLSPQQREEYEAIKAEKRGKVFGSYTDNSLTADPEQLFYEKIIETMKKGKLTPEVFKLSCEVSGKNAELVRRKVNAMLKETGLGKTTKDFIMTDRQKKRKDFLGFNVNQENSPAETNKGDVQDVI